MFHPSQRDLLISLICERHYSFSSCYFNCLNNQIKIFFTKLQLHLSGESNFNRDISDQTLLKPIYNSRYIINRTLCLNFFRCHLRESGYYKIHVFEITVQPNCFAQERVWVISYKVSYLVWSSARLRVGILSQ